MLSLRHARRQGGRKIWGWPMRRLPFESRGHRQVDFALNRGLPSTPRRRHCTTSPLYRNTDILVPC
jgi:hypothetical protein